MVELADRVLPLALDGTGSEMAAGAMAEAGVELLCGTTVERFRAEGSAVAGATLASGREIDCGMAVLATGVVPELGPFENSGVEVDRGILVDERCRTSVPGVYAAGDVAQGTDALSGVSRPIPIFPNAHRQGRVAGVNMAGGAARVGAAFAMNSVEVFGLPTISAGLATADGDGFEVLSRLGPDARAYRRIVLREGRVVGALFVGDIDRAGIFTGLIRHGVDVSRARDLLLTDEFGLLSLPREYRKHVVTGEGIEV
jgi:NAD(P)H-nitrite reductase large subunit